MTDLLAKTLSRCAYEGIEFPATSVDTEWGHDSVEHKAHLRPGADIETTGRRPLKVSVEAVFVNTFRGWPTDLYPTVWRRLIEKIASTPKGVFTHPTRGFMDVHMDDISEPIKARSPRNGQIVTLRMTEDNATASVQIGSASTDSIGHADPGAAMSSIAAAADAEGGTLATSDTQILPLRSTPLFTQGDGTLRTLVSGVLSYLEASPRPYVDARAALESIRVSARAVLALPVFASIQAHDMRVGMLDLIAATDAYEDRYLGTARPTTYTTTQEMSLARIATVLYGSPSKVSLLRAANSISDGLFVPKGTSFIILPAAA